MARVAITLQTTRFEAAIATLKREGVPKLSAKAINRVMFDAREAEGAHVSRIFDFAGPNTRRFISEGFRFNKARPSRLRADLFPLRKSANVLDEHVFGNPFTARDGGRLSFTAPDGPKLAVPIGVKRTSRGTVRRGQKPSELVTPDEIGRLRAGQRKRRGEVNSGRRAFLAKSGKAILIPVRKRSRKVRVLYALVDRARVPRTFRFFEVFERVARKQLPRKVDQEFRKLRDRGFVS